MNFVSDVLNECRAHAATTPFDLGLIGKYLADYEELLMQLVTENRFQRFLTSNRVRKKLEILNSNLHTEVSKIFLKLRTDRRPSAQSARAQAPRAAAAMMRDDTMVRYLNELEPAAKQMWEENFGEVRNQKKKKRKFLAKKKNLVVNHFCSRYYSFIVIHLFI